MVERPNVGIRLNLRWCVSNHSHGRGSNRKNGFLPAIELLYSVVADSVQNTEEVDPHGLPDPKLKFVHEIGHKQRVEVETMFAQTNGERRLYKKV